MLSVELLTAVQEQWLCRESQIQQLAALLNPEYPSPQVIVVYGSEATAKTSVVRCVLDTLKVRHAFINCQETISQRHLLHKALQTCIGATPGAANLDIDQKCEHLNTLAVQLQRLFEYNNERFALVLDGVDRQREAGPTLLPSLARLGEMIPNLTVIMIVSSNRPLPFQRVGVPYLHFPPYSRAEAVNIVARHPPPPPSDCTAPILSDSARLSNCYTLFTTAVYDSLIAPTSRSLPSLRKTCLRLWPKFIQPVVQDQPPPPNSSEWDFAKLFLRNRSLFQAEGEGTIISRIETSANPLTTHGPSSTDTQDRLSTQPTSLAAPPSPLLKYTTTLLLLAAYLASHTSPKVDILLFSRLSNSTTKSRRMKKSYHRKKLNFSTSSVATSSTPTKRQPHDSDFDLDVRDTSSPTKKTPSKRRIVTPAGPQAKVGKAIWSLQAKIPHPFPLDRLTSIYRAIHPEGIGGTSSVSSHQKPTTANRNHHVVVSDNLMSSLVELARLRLVVPVSSSAVGTDEVGGGSGAEREGRWRVNVRREFVEERCREWGVGDEGVGAVGEWEI